MGDLLNSAAARRPCAGTGLSGRRPLRDGFGGRAPRGRGASEHRAAEGVDVVPAVNAGA